MLSSIPDRELIARLEQLRRDDRVSCVEILHHLNEVERRSLHLRLGYSSLFAYCTGRLCYSEPAAAQRVRVARCLHRFPRVGPMLESGEINLITLGLVANIVTEATLDAWLERIRGRTQREVETMASAVRPPITLRDRARVVQVAVPVRAPLPLTPVSGANTDAAANPSMFAAAASEPEMCEASSRPAESGGTVNVSGNSEAGEQHSFNPVPTQTRVYIQFLVDQSFMKKYRTAIALLSNRLPKISFEAVFSALIDDFVRRNEPAARQQRREHAAARGRREAASPVVPLPTRDAVFTRDSGRCTYVGSDGKRCNETIRLHVDHIKPRARGGTNELANLRLLCARHNRLQAERLFGRDVMNKFRHREEPGGGAT